MYNQVGNSIDDLDMLGNLYPLNNILCSKEQKTSGRKDSLFPTERCYPSVESDRTMDVLRKSMLKRSSFQAVCVAENMQVRKTALRITCNTLSGGR
jgi:hypothetical protein